MLRVRTMKKALSTLFVTLVSISSLMAAQNCPASLQKVAKANNEFGLSLFQGVMSEKPTENVLISPLSASVALYMAQNGARGETLAELERALRTNGISVDQLNRGAKLLLESFRTYEGAETISVANSLWANEGLFVFDPAYQSLVKGAYNAPLNIRRFSDPKTVVEINQWVSDQTRKMIPTLVEKLDPDNVAILLNALFVEGQWLTPFEKYRTKDAQFNLLSGDEKTVPFMNNADHFKYAEGESWQMVQLQFNGRKSPEGEQFPRKEEGRFQVEIILPKEGVDFVKFAKDLSPRDMDQMRAKLEGRYIDLSLPKLKFDFNSSLVNTLKAMGVEKAFDEAGADFTAMGSSPTGRNVFISEVLQKTALQMDEAGLKAAAVTAVFMGLESMAPRPTAQFIADRPFIISVRDKETGSVLFYGSIIDPKN